MSATMSADALVATCRIALKSSPGHRRPAKQQRGEAAVVWRSLAADSAEDTRGVDLLTRELRRRVKDAKKGTGHEFLAAGAMLALYGASALLFADIGHLAGLF